jgi:hypothetical protein
MPKGGDIYYRCRSCGVTYVRAHAPDVLLAVQCAVFDFMSQPRDWGIILDDHDVHQCAPGKWGVADIVGGTEDE